MEHKGLAPSTIDRRLSTICGFYRFAHIDGRVNANPAQYVRRPKVHPSEGRGLDRREFGTFLFTAERFDRDHAALAVLLGLKGLRSGGMWNQHRGSRLHPGARTLRIMGKGSEPEVIPLVPRAARTIDLAIGERTTARFCVGRMEPGSIGEPPTAGCVQSASKRSSTPCTRTCSGPPSSWPHSMRAFLFVMSRSPLATDPRTTTVYDRRRENFDRHAAYVVVAFVAGG